MRKSYLFGLTLRENLKKLRMKSSEVVAKKPRGG